MASISDDSSGDDDERYTTTNVTLGYASKEPTDDTFSHLGGNPVRLNSRLLAVTAREETDITPDLARR